MNIFIFCLPSIQIIPDWKITDGITDGKFSSGINKRNKWNYFLGTRVDSVMLLEEGFEVQSADISDKMLKQAYETRWKRRREDIFDRWGN